MTTVALLGNPNVGKTTLFNALTGSNQYVGNWPGVTVEKKEGYFKDIKIVDLPGIYAMDTFSNEEIVSKEFLLRDDVDVILNIVDGSKLDRNLYLTTQLKKFNKPIILAINMIDVLESNGFEIDFEKLSSEMDVTVVPISAAKKSGLKELTDIIENKKWENSISNERFDFKSEKEAYKFIENTLKKSINKSASIKKPISEKLDKFILHPILAFPIFIVAIALMFQLTFAWVGQPISDWLDGLLNDSLIPYLSHLLSGTSPWFSSLLVDGIVAGVGSIIVLLPVILTLFACITFLEESGYMARVAFLMDKIMRKMGLSGKAFIPLIIGFGCNVPAIMSARTLESEKDRKLTALLVPLMSCNARLAIYSVFVSIFFKEHQGLIVASLYFLSVFIAFILGVIFKKTLFKKQEEPFIIELPSYSMPQLSSIALQVWEKCKSFLKKAGTLIFAMSVLIWFLSNFNASGMAADVNSSFLAQIGQFISPIFAPLGFGNWQSAVSLLSGLLAKESVISTMQIVYAGDLNTVLPTFFTAVSAYSFLVFVLLYVPCISTIGAMKKEYGAKLTTFSFVFQTTLAWVVSLIVFGIGSLIM
ncbi:ferrous iron transport protein B [Clostridium thermobutyricum]|uniref:Ferrous iron transport protein B n=1 Tax=Clostridium thermobutyricum DSM 4928 TaxID=1121339 RepID=A0A1V4SRT7_9CLOT|nr:ferrous iron transport protein B [Clostridium thermobutyricum]OPX46564.1 ferrous iron transport protein B [Clostridium thermobutyricum DSM 4928]